MPFNYPLQFNLHALLISLSEATDLVSPALVRHHRQVSYIAGQIGMTMDLSEDDLRDLSLAGALHDIGGLSLADRLETLDFEMKNPQHHADAGAVLLGGFKPFRRIAELVRFHHVYWNSGAGEFFGTEPVPRLSHMLHLADRIAVLLNPQQEILDQMETIPEKIRKNAGRMFIPEMVEAFRQLAIRESFWLDVAEPARCLMFGSDFPKTIAMTKKDLLDLALLFSRIIDFRSRFTATHSSGVSAVAVALAGKIGLDDKQQDMLRIAGLLHDAGKLVVPRETLEKRQPLTHADFIFIRRHPYYSRRILQAVPEFAAISEWSAFHHERLDGTGYPFHVNGEKLSVEARLLSVADTFTALTEERPYRPSLSSRVTQNILESMARSNKLDGDMVLAVGGNLAELNSIRKDEQRRAFDFHNRFMKKLRACGSMPSANEATSI